MSAGVQTVGVTVGYNTTCKLSYQTECVLRGGTTECVLQGELPIEEYSVVEVKNVFVEEYIFMFYGDEKG